MGSLIDILRNVLSYLTAFESFLFLTSWTIGVALVIASIRAFKAKGENPRGNEGGLLSPMTTFIMGVCFISLPGFMRVATYSLFGMETPNASAIFEYAPQTVGMFEDGSAAREMITGITAIVMFGGAIAIMRGFLLLNAWAKSNGQDRKSWGAGLTHAIAGVLCVNAPLTVSAFEKMVS